MQKRKESQLSSFYYYPEINIVLVDIQQMFPKAWCICKRNNYNVKNTE